MQIGPSGILTIPYDIYSKHWSNDIITNYLYSQLNYSNYWTADAIQDIDGVDPDRNTLSTFIPWDDPSSYDDFISMITVLQKEKIPFTIAFDDADDTVGIYAYGYFLEDGSYITDNWDISYIVHVVLGGITSDHPPSLESAQMLYEALQHKYCIRWHEQRMRETADIQMKYFALAVAEMILKG